MISSLQLAQRLSTLNCLQVARECGLSSKTIYRLRHQQTVPKLDTAIRVMEAIERIEKREVAQ